MSATDIMRRTHNYTCPHMTGFVQRRTRHEGHNVSERQGLSELETPESLVHAFLLYSEQIDVLMGILAWAPPCSLGCWTLFTPAPLNTRRGVEPAAGVLMRGWPYPPVHPRGG